MCHYRLDHELCFYCRSGCHPTVAAASIAVAIVVAARNVDVATAIVGR
jgi:hypothetical protein